MEEYQNNDEDFFLFEKEKSKYYHNYKEDEEEMRKATKLSLLEKIIYGVIITLSIINMSRAIYSCREFKKEMKEKANKECSFNYFSNFRYEINNNFDQYSL